MDSSIPTQEPTPQIRPETVSKDKKKHVHCKFYNTKKGCRSGESCPFTHDAFRSAASAKQPNQRRNAQEPSDGTSDSQPSSVNTGQSTGPITRDDAASLQPTGRQPLKPLRPVPIAQQKDPRAFQISQVKRRFSPEEIIDVDSSTTTLNFSLHPSDPDFPFDLPRGLECSLIIPDTYLSLENHDGKPKLKVRNEEMGALWRSRVEDGFTRLFHGIRSNITLLSSLNRLDRDLEALLTDKKPELVTIIPNRNKAPSVQAVSERVQEQEQAQPSQTRPSRYTEGQLASASQRRQSEVQQLEARLGRIPGFSRSADGTSFMVPIVPRKPSELPVHLRMVSKTCVSVPILYPLQSCSVVLQDVDKDAAAPVERAFARKVEKGDGTLMGHINMLAQNMQVLVAEGKALEVEGLTQSTADEESGVDAADLGKPELRIDEDRDHVRYISRPPEWEVSNANHDAHEESGDSSSSESEIDSDEESGGTEDEEDSTPTAAAAAAAASSKPTPSAERGISLSFPTLELYSIELLELSSLSITVKCSRCKDTMDIPNLRHSIARSQSCKKCAIAFTLTYRRELIHANSTRAGYLDLEGCTVVDMLPSTFLPTCSQCSTTPSPSSGGVVSVRGASSLAICRECHAKMTFKIPDVKFLIVTPGSSTGAPALKKKKPRENLGITTGTELPRRGRCGHYSKSYRWFRFSCCEKVFPCDRCHDAECDHPVEHANRMICGWCSREQNYRPEDCGFCHASVIKKAGSGFWEGGKGTRDKARMSRKDPRKYKRPPGGALRKK